MLIKVELDSFNRGLSLPRIGGSGLTVSKRMRLCPIRSQNLVTLRECLSNPIVLLAFVRSG